MKKTQAFAKILQHIKHPGYSVRTDLMKFHLLHGCLSHCFESLIASSKWSSFFFLWTLNLIGSKLCLVYCVILQFQGKQISSLDFFQLIQPLPTPNLSEKSWIGIQRYLWGNVLDSLYVSIMNVIIFCIPLHFMSHLVNFIYNDNK